MSDATPAPRLLIIDDDDSLRELFAKPIHYADLADSIRKLLAGRAT